MVVILIRQSVAVRAGVDIVLPFSVPSPILAGEIPARRRRRTKHRIGFSGTRQPLHAGQRDGQKQARPFTAQVSMTKLPRWMTGINSPAAAIRNNPRLMIATARNK